MWLLYYCLDLWTIPHKHQYRSNRMQSWGRHPGQTSMVDNTNEHLDLRSGRGVGSIASIRPPSLAFSRAPPATTRCMRHEHTARSVSQPSDANWVTRPLWRFTPSRPHPPAEPMVGRDDSVRPTIETIPAMSDGSNGISIHPLHRTSTRIARSRQAILDGHSP